MKRFFTMVLLAVISGHYIGLTPAFAQSQTHVKRCSEKHMQVKGITSKQPISKKDLPKIQTLEDKENGLLITIAEDGTEYVIDKKQRLAIIRKDSVILQSLILDAGMATQASVAQGTKPVESNIAIVHSH